MARESSVLHETLNLYVTPDLYTFEPADPSGNRDAVSKSLTINRLTGDILLNDSDVPAPSKSFRALTVYGMVGLLTLSTTDFLVLITGRSPARGRMNGHTVYLATEFRVLPVATPSRNSLVEHPVEKHLVDLVEHHLASSVLWFSYGWDLTRTLQAQTVNPNEGRPLWQTADDRFFWNKFLQSRFIDITTSNPDQDLSRYILPIIYGSFDIRQTHIGRIPFNFALISRRSRYRAGTRYFTRGIDNQGHAANFNETEQIIFIDEEGDNDKVTNTRVGYGGLAEVAGTTRMSFVQTRGSVPVYWAEINNLRYKPDLQVMDRSDTPIALRLHLMEQIRMYGSQVLVNLVKQKGHEKPIKEAYERRLAECKIDNVHYEYWDFATETKGMKFEKVKILVDRLADHVQDIGYFHQKANGPIPLKLQKGIIRSNCMDCLDRTNVVQCAFAKHVLSQQLRSIGVLGEKEQVDDHEEFMDVFRNVWADHADYVSKAYSGSGALKTDYTRTGMRTKQGLLQDGQNSMVRYIKNNYFDGDRQDAFDLFTGAWVPRRGPATSLSLVIDSRPLITRSMPYTLLFSLFMVFAGLSLPRASNYSLFYYNMFWIFFAFISLFYILGHGVEYVAWPRLNPPIEIILYEGPGFKSGPKGKGFRIPFGLDQKIFKGGLRIGGKYSYQHRKPAEEMEMGLKKRVD